MTLTLLIINELAVFPSESLMVILRLDLGPDGSPELQFKRKGRVIGTYFYLVQPFSVKLANMPHISLSKYQDHKFHKVCIDLQFFFC